MSLYTREDLKYNRSLKKSIFEVLLKETTTFYIHSKFHSSLFIGSRGLKEKEKEEGIILVFGPYSYRNLEWNEKGISCEMNFGKWEMVFIPYESIFRIFDKAGHFIFQFITFEITGEVEQTEKAQSQTEDSVEDADKVIKINFQKKKKKDEKT